jgi:enoyl-CoA hydratase
MLFTSRPISGLEAVQCGLANHAYPENELLDKASTMAKTIAKKSPLSLKAAIKLLNHTKTEEFFSGVEKEAELFSAAFSSKDGKEGISAFIDKREPKFRGD